MARGDEDLPKKVALHEIGQDLSALSREELDRRIGLLKEEIARIERERAAKDTTHDAANALFRS